MKDYYDLWAIPKTVAISDDELEAATFARRETPIPTERPPGLSADFTSDETKRRQWRAYADSIELSSVSLEEIIEVIWALVGPCCERLAAR